MITYTFEPTYDGVNIQVWLCGALVYETVRRPPLDCENPFTYFDTEASRATLLEAAQPTIDALRQYFAPMVDVVETMDGGASAFAHGTYGYGAYVQLCYWGKDDKHRPTRRHRTAIIAGVKTKLNWVK